MAGAAAIEPSALNDHCKEPSGCIAYKLPDPDPRYKCPFGPIAGDVIIPGSPWNFHLGVPAGTSISKIIDPSVGPSSLIFLEGLVRETTPRSSSIIVKTCK